MSRSRVFVSGFAVVVCLSFGSSALAQSGACCSTNEGYPSPGPGMCGQATASSCGAGFVYMGDGTDCSTVTCPFLGSPRGAWCSCGPEGCTYGCVVADQNSLAGTVYAGDGTTCEPDLGQFWDDCPAFCGNGVLDGTEQCDWADDSACPGQCPASALASGPESCICPGGGPGDGACCDPSGACTDVASASACSGGSTFLAGISCSFNPCLAAGVCGSDSDWDGIQDNVDPAPNYPSSSFQNATVTPPTNGGIPVRGHQSLCVSKTSKGVKACSVGVVPGGFLPAKVEAYCSQQGPGQQGMGGTLTAPKCLDVFCGNSVTGEAVIGDIDLELLKDDVVFATLSLPEGNSVTFDGDTLEVTAPPTNDTTLTVVTPSGEEQPVAPGGTTTLPGSGPIPAVSTWGLAVLTLLLLVGGKIYFRRRRAVKA